MLVCHYKLNYRLYSDFTSFSMNMFFFCCRFSVLVVTSPWPSLVCDSFSLFCMTLTVLEHWSGSFWSAQFQSVSFFPLMIRPHNSEVLKFSQTSCGFWKEYCRDEVPFLSQVGCVWGRVPMSS